MYKIDLVFNNYGEGVGWNMWVNTLWHNHAIWVGHENFPHVEGGPWTNPLPNPPSPALIVDNCLMGVTLQVQLDCADREGLLSLQPDGSVTVLPSHGGQEYQLLTSTQAFSLQALINLGVLKQNSER